MTKPPHGLKGRPSNNAGKRKASAKTATVALRLLPADSALLASQAALRQLSRGDYVAELVRADAAASALNPVSR